MGHRAASVRVTGVGRNRQHRSRRAELSIPLIRLRFLQLGDVRRDPPRLDLAQPQPISAGSFTPVPPAFETKGRPAEISGSFAIFAAIRRVCRKHAGRHSVAPLVSRAAPALEAGFTTTNDGSDGRLGAPRRTAGNT